MATGYAGQSTELATGVGALTRSQCGVTLFCGTFGHWDRSFGGVLIRLPTFPHLVTPLRRLGVEPFNHMPILGAASWLPPLNGRRHMQRLLPTWTPGLATPWLNPPADGLEVWLLGRKYVTHSWIPPHAEPLLCIQ